MTVYGKILVLTNFGLSVMALIWAMVFYSERIDWTNSKTGQLTPRINRIKQLGEELGPIEASWRDVHADLAQQEGYRAVDRPWFAEQVVHARTTATAQDPARTVVYNNGVLVLEPQPKEPKHLRPKVIPAVDDQNKPLASLAFYNKDEADKRNAVIAEETKLKDLADKDKDLSNLLTPEEGKGLRQRIEDEKVKVKLVDEELAIAQPLRINTAVENELVLRRDKMLRARIDELKAALGMASGMK